MDWYGMSDSAIIAELGNRLKSYRLRKNYTQEELAQNRVSVWGLYIR